VPQDGTTRSVMLMARLMLILALVCHFLACGFVIVGRASDAEGLESWLHYEMRGPFVSADTTGLNGDDHVYSM